MYSRICLLPAEPIERYKYYFDIKQTKSNQFYLINSRLFPTNAVLLENILLKLCSISESRKIISFSKNTTKVTNPHSGCKRLHNVDVLKSVLAHRKEWYQKCFSHYF